MSGLLINEFERLWESGDGPPDVFAFLSQHPDSDMSEVVAVLLHDQQQRWQTDAPLRAEDYLSRFPDLASDPDCKLQLAVGEFQARRDCDTLPSIDEFTSRFTDIIDQLRSKLWELVSGENRKDKIDLTTTQTYVSDKTVGDQQIGRYRLVRILGEGAFGRVYLGFDEELQRQVAIKVPTEERFQKPEDAEQYLEEARNVASLDHPNIVPVYDTGRTEDGSIFAVSKFIEGRTLRDRIKEDRPYHHESAMLVATVALAIQNAHDKRLIHRDIKPSNILIEESLGTPYVADFGLAIKEDDYLSGGTTAGSPAYMSPEQARGEGHRLDGRSDIFSLGIVFYELLTGTKPFRGSTASELLRQIVSVDPPRPREVDNSIPVELERICFKALSKRASDRYPTAAEFADDLLHWQQGPEQETKELTIVPKGLRSFDADDADFFLELLPGPRNRDGLPESIQFWKTRIEETDPDKTFSVGLIYGPSGCGKSSLVKAGLLPRLSQNVVAVYIEATPDETEFRILRGIQKRLPELPTDLSLVETFTLLRRNELRKVVVVLDQFEQWLHGHRAEQDAELVRALRQCDGGALQVVVMVRDDFWMAASRFMGDVEVEILQGTNISAVDLFSVKHAQKVLGAFGRAYGDLDTTLKEQNHVFLEQAASGLAQDGKVVSIRLALFAEMVKGRLWVPDTLQEVGGTEGIGVNFLEETFSSRTGNPKHRLHQQAARKVLKALLPDVGSDIKGHMRSDLELLEASGYANRPSDFRDLLCILDGVLRLITPTDPVGFQTEPDSDSGSKFYQLTHDYLVPSLRVWLTRKQRESRRGRAEMLLEQRSAIWSVRPEGRHSLSAWEFLKCAVLTSHKHWTKTQRDMMRRARTRLLFGAFVFVIGTILSLVFFKMSQEREADLLNSRFQVNAQQRHRAVEIAFRSASKGIRAVRTRVGGQVSRQRFAEVTSFRFDDSEHLLGLCWVPKVSADELAAHEELASQDGLVDYRVHRAGGDSRTQAGEPGRDQQQRSDIAFPVFFAEPSDKNGPALGLDLQSIPEFVAAAEHSLEVGHATTTRPFGWPFDGGTKQVIAWILPVAKNRVAEATADERLKNLNGFVIGLTDVGSMITDTLVADTIGPFPEKIDVVLSHSYGSEGREVVAAFDSIDRVAKFGEAARLLDARKLREPDLDNPIPLAQPLEDWSVESIATDSYIAAQTSPMPTIVLVVALLFAAMAAASVARV